MQNYNDNRFLQQIEIYIKKYSSYCFNNVIMLDNVEQRKKTTIIPFFEVLSLSECRRYTKFVYEKSGMIPL